MALIKGISKNVFIIGVVSLLNDASSEMIFPLLPLFMVNVLGASMAIVGVIEGLAESASSFIKPVSGYLSDKMRKRKPLTVSGYALSAFTKPFFAISTSWVHILLVRTLDRVGKGIRTAPRDAIIAESTRKNIRGKAFGFHRTMDTLGAVIGPAMAFVLLPMVGNEYRILFLIAVIPAIFSVALTSFIKEPGVPKIRSNNLSFIKSFSTLPAKAKSFILIASLFALANFSFAFLILRANSLGVPAVLATMLYLLFNLVYAGASIPVGVAGDKFGRRKILLWGYLAFALMFVGWMLASEAWQAWPLFALYGFAFAINEVLGRTAVSDLVSAEQRGAAFGAYHGAVGIAVFPASAVAGILWQFFGPGAAFAWGALLALVAAVLLSRLDFEKRVFVKRALGKRRL